jgi:hypothetical protein
MSNRLWLRLQKAHSLAKPLLLRESRAGAAPMHAQIDSRPDAEGER